MAEIVNDEVDNPDEDKLSIGKKFEQIYIDLLSTFKIKAFRTHILMYLGCYISQDIFSQVYTYFVVFALGFTTVIASNVPIVIWSACIVGVVHTLVIMLAVGTLAFLLMGYIASFKFKLTKDKMKMDPEKFCLCGS